MFGDTMIVNGKAWPFLNVEPRRYRFRLLNGADSRFFTFAMSYPNAKGKSIAVPFYQIGGDGGLLAAPLKLNQLTFGPGERIDVIIDFTQVPANAHVTMTNSAPGPMPTGELPDANTSQIMQFRVNQPLNTAIPNLPIPTTLRGGVNQPAPIAPLTPTAGAPVRQLGLFEGIDEFGQITPRLGTMATGPLDFMSPITENPAVGATEIWELYKTTPDTHPIHLHLVQFQVVSVQRFNVKTYNRTGQIKLIGKASPPAAPDAGWKDTIQVRPGQVVRVIATFDVQGKYVWHCHILSHEEHDMMRPFFVGTMSPLVMGIPAEAAALNVFGTAPIGAVEEQVAKAVLE